MQKNVSKSSKSDMKGYLEFNVCDNLLIFAKPNNKKNNQTSY
jgi:hypothetical protein